jgi:polysaccharide pyruvyl transferase WcaK-like protein
MQKKLIEYPFTIGKNDKSNYIPENWNGKTLLHIAVHRGWKGKDDTNLNLNAGDTALNPLVRKIIDTKAGNFRWILRQVWEPIDSIIMQKLQDKIDGIVIGGGGLFLKEQPGTDLSKSGWTWNCNIDALDKMIKPTIIFAVGYNRFRGHDDFGDTFFQHINKLTQKCKFVGMRNQGSIDALKKYIDNRYDKSKIKLQVCPTTLIWHLIPKYQKITKQHDSKNKKTLILNAAFDRSKLRYGSKIDEILYSISNSVLKAQNENWEIKLAAHKTEDRNIEKYLDKVGVNYVTHDLSGGSLDDVVSFYAKSDLVIGMRGHAQMIPFGLRRPIISIISHDKMRFFLKDINCLEWGIDVKSHNFEKKLDMLISNVHKNKKIYLKKLSNVQEKLWKITQPNLKLIKNIFLNSKINF